ncbi:MAG: M28 family peptidase [Bryobacteraceae bacterium]
MHPRRLALLAVSCALFATEPNNATRRWWAHVTALSNDSLQGRDTGSEGYRKAAAYVVAQFERNGLQPAGEHGFYQTVPLHVLRFRADRSTVELVRANGSTKLQWLRQITVPARPGTPESIDAALLFAGSGQPPEGVDPRGKILVQLGGGRGAAGGRGGGGGGRARGSMAGTLSIDSLAGPEPPRWPVQYAVQMTVADGSVPAGVPSGVPAGPGNGDGSTPAGVPAGAPSGPGNGEASPGPAPLALRFNPEFAEMLFEGSGHSFKELMGLRDQEKPLPWFAIPATLKAHLSFESGDLQSDNILAALPGADPELAKEYVVVSAHLDGYGIGEPWGSDNIYNGAFDDAAYVATLIDMAERLHESGKKLKRSILFCVVTGEEKGLLGSKYFTAHPTIPKQQLVADINLDQLRPLFPLHTLTMLAMDESTLGDTVKSVAGSMDIKIQPDPEPGRNLLRRSDHYSFMQIGVPSTGFIFGYVPGTPDEAAYREWYARRYHTPLDDLNQPWVPDAAAKFNDFFNKLVETLANASERPHWKAGSTFAK